MARYNVPKAAHNVENGTCNQSDQNAIALKLPNYPLYFPIALFVFAFLFPVFL